MTLTGTHLLRRALNVHLPTIADESTLSRHKLPSDSKQTSPRAEGHRINSSDHCNN